MSYNHGEYNNLWMNFSVVKWTNWPIHSDGNAIQRDNIIENIVLEQLTE